LGSGGGGVGENCTNKVRVQVNAEKMMICSYVQVEKNPYRKMFPKGWADLKGLYIRISFSWRQHDWTGDTLLSMLFIKQYLY